MADIIVTPFLEMAPPEVGSGIIKDDTFIAPFPIELISTIPAADYDINHPRQFRRVAHVLVEDCLPGDIITVVGKFECTSEFSLVEFSAGLVLTPDATGTAGIQDVPGDMFAIGLGEVPPNGAWIDKIAGYNLSLQMHHGIFPVSGAVIVPEGMSGDLYAAIICYIGGVQFWPTSHTVVVEPECGNLFANRKRKQA